MLPRFLLIAGVAAVIAGGLAAPGAAGASRPAQSAIYGGTIDRQVGVGWVAALMHHPSVDSGDQYQRQFCGGSLVAPGWVLTAAHCVFNDDGVVAASALQVLVGSKRLNSTGGQVSDVTRVVVLYGYNDSTSYHDAALLRLADPVSVRPVPVATSSQTASYRPGTRSYIAGWGDRLADTNPNMSFPYTLHSAFIPVRPNIACRRAWGARFSAGSMFCAGFGRPDTCKGDSGGPIAVRLGVGRWRLTGVTSFGRCGVPSDIGVYTRLSAPGIRSWLSRTIASG